MKKNVLFMAIIAISVALSSFVSCNSNDEKQAVSKQQQVDTVAEVQQMVVEDYDTIEPAHLYVEVKEGKFLDLVMWNNGNGLIKQLGYDFAGGYCKKCDITISKCCWESEELCSEWLTSRFGDDWYDKIDVKTFVSYLYFGDNEEMAKQFPDRNKTKQQIAQYCRKVYLPKNTLDSCLLCGFFDYNAFDFKFDGLDVNKWQTKYWNKYVDIEVVNWKQDKTLATDTSKTYFVTYKYKFHKSRRGGWGGSEITLRTRLTEYSNGTYKIKDDDPNIYQSFDYD